MLAVVNNFVLSATDKNTETFDTTLLMKLIHKNRQDFIDKKLNIYEEHGRKLKFHPNFFLGG